MPISILVHGGAGSVAPDDDPGEQTRGCLEAAREGYEVLRQGGSAVSAVERAARVLEDNPLFNAGTGACLNADGEVEADASIMDGLTLAAGAVAAVKGVKNPIRLARTVMDRTPHVLMTGEGALRLARDYGVELVDPGSLITARARARLEAFRRKREAAGGNTIGAVALDSSGHLAAATSTGGTVGKLAGRIGDTPLIGCGTYADDLSGAVSATGQGESIIKAVLSKYTCDLLRIGRGPQEAADAAVRELTRVGGEGGVIVVDRGGNLAFGFNTQRMSRAWVNARGAEGVGYEAPPPAFSVLIVDDDPAVVALFRSITWDLPLRLRFGGTAEEGLSLVEAEVPQLIISDYRLPGLDGLTFLERVQATHPRVKRILFTGEAIMRTSVGLDVPVLGKPCSPETLRELLMALASESAS